MEMQRANFREEVEGSGFTLFLVGEGERGSRCPHAIDPVYDGRMLDIEEAVLSRQTASR